MGIHIAPHGCRILGQAHFSEQPHASDCPREALAVGEQPPQRFAMPAQRRLVECNAHKNKVRVAQQHRSSNAPHVRRDARVRYPALDKHSPQILSDARCAYNNGELTRSLLHKLKEGPCNQRASARRADDAFFASQGQSAATGDSTVRTSSHD